MSKYLKQLTVCAAVVFCCIITGYISVYAATANIDIPAQSVANGEEVHVNVNVTSEENIGTFDLRITYDSSILEYVSGADNGGSGVLQILNSELNQTNTVTKELVFRALKEGSSDIAVQAASSNVLDMGANPMDIAGGLGNITVGGSNGASSDNNLTSLSISGVDSEGSSHDLVITPEFSQDVTEYRAEVGENIVRLSVSAIVSNPSANTKISGVQLEPGDNLTTVAVTAADGQVKEYKIYTVKNGGTPSEGNKTNTDLLPVPEDLSPVFSEKTGKYIIQTFDEIGIPEGFVPCGCNYGDRPVAALSGFNGSVIAICLADDENGANAALFIYNESMDSFTLYNTYMVNEKPYVMLTPDKDTVIPEGFNETVVKINGVDTMSWQGGMYSDYSEIYLLYAANNLGEKGFYIYDSLEGVLVRFPSSASDNKVTSDSELQSKYDELKKQVSEDDIIKLEIIIGYSVLCIILIIYVSVLIYKLKKLKPEDEDEEKLEEFAETASDIDSSSDEKTKPELKLDMAMQANEVKMETLANDVNAILDEDKTDEVEKKEEEKKSEEENGNSINDNTGETKEDNADKTETKDEVQGEGLGIVFVDLEDDSKK
ncbi:MAG: cohesin domain-containing protein [Lachnospiraceae bacterium]|nr:cohesin domain-containing protein [Lachnospiraceae bacterium]MDE6253316.1 cohesin domain-containing protein [Lachnospiraceae bacterium]